MWPVIGYNAAGYDHQTGNAVRVLITGAAGFVGRHLSRHLLDTVPELDAHGTVLPGIGQTTLAGITSHEVDLRDSASVSALFDRLQPQQVYHLAAQANVRRSFDAVWETLETNIRSELNVIQACLSLPARPRLLVISTGEMYDPADLPSREDSALRPSSPYSVSKVTQDMLALQYFLSDGLPTLRARPFNHLGPGQSEGFVAPDFAMQIARIEDGQQEPRLFVGNLSARRDFTDVRDVVHAYRLIMERGEAGSVYNIASNQTHTIQALLDGMLRHARVPIEVCPDSNRMRPSGTSILWGDATRLHAATGWQPTIPFEQTLLDVLNDCRQRVRPHPQE